MHQANGRNPMLVKPFVLLWVELSAFTLRAAIGALDQIWLSKFCFQAKKIFGHSQKF